MLLLLLSLAWITGIALGPVLGLPYWTIAFAVLPLVLLPFFRPWRRKLLALFPILLLFLGGIIISAPDEKPADQSHLQYYIGVGKVTVEGMISDNPVIRDRSTTFQIEATSITTGSVVQKVSGTALVKALPYGSHKYGDIVRLKGTLENPRNNNRFNYVSYLAARDIYSEINFPEVETVQRGQGSFFFSTLYNIRDSLAISIERALPQPHAALAQAMFLGITTDVPQDLRDQFTRTGTNHILAVSGMNLTIVMGLLLALGVWAFGRKYSIYVWLSLLIVWLYSLLTGMQPPIVRSAVMGSMFLVAELLGRQKNALTAITFAAAVMLAFNTRLLGDVSFQLSFLSLCGLILIYPELSKLPVLEKLDPDRGSLLRTISHYLVAGLLVTVSAILSTWPVITYNFGISALLALPATIFILPVLPAIILVTFVVSIFGLFAPVLAQVTGWLDWLLISYFTLIVQLFSAVPFSAIPVVDWKFWQTPVYYAGLILLLAGFKNRSLTLSIFRKIVDTVPLLAAGAEEYLLRLPLKWVVPGLLIVTALLWSAMANIPDDQLHVSILDIGQGDAILIQTPERQKILIDGGPGPDSLELALGKKLPFWDRRIDLVIFTQPQADHIKGLIEVIKSYQIGMVACAPTVSDSTVFAQLKEAIKQKKLSVSQLCSLQAFSNGNGLILEVLYPVPDAPPCKASDPDCNDLVLRLSYKQVSFLFTADVDIGTEKMLVNNRARLGSTVLKVGHHGSSNSSSSEFLAVVNPVASAISVGKDNSYGHPDPGLLERLRNQIEPGNIYLTSESGTIEFISDGDKLWIRTGKD